MFGKKKKVINIPFIIHENGIPNIQDNWAIKAEVDEIKECIRFIDARSKENITASLPFEKIIGLELGEKGNSAAGSSTGGAIIGAAIGGTTGAVIGSTTGKKAAFIPTLKIKYLSEGEEKEINLYESNIKGGISLLNTCLGNRLQQNKAVETHIEL